MISESSDLDKIKAKINDITNIQAEVTFEGIVSTRAIETELTGTQLTKWRSIQTEFARKFQQTQNAASKTTASKTTASETKTIGVSSSPPPTSGVISPSAPPATPLVAEEVYNDAYRIFQEGRYPESRAAFAKFFQQFPQTEYSDNAQFWIGEAYFKEGKTEQAILAFEDVVKKYPQGNKAPDALVKQGICFKILGDKDNARIILRRVIDKYPNTPQSNTARKQLEGLL